MKTTLPLPAWLHPQADEALKACSATWLQSLKQTNWDACVQHGLPTRKQERWKYADLSVFDEQLFATITKANISTDLVNQISSRYAEMAKHIRLVMINGHLCTELSDLTLLPDNVIVCSMQEALVKHADLVRKQIEETNTTQHPFATLNTALFSDGLFFYVPDDCQLQTSVHIFSVATADTNFAVYPRHVFLLGKQSHLNIVEEYVALTSASYLMNTVTTMQLQPGAHLQYCKIQNESARALHIAALFVDQQQDSHAEFVTMSLGARFARDDLAINLLGANAQCSTSGFYHLQQDQQYVDQHVDINHLAPYSSSDMLYKGVLNKKSRAVFNGRLHVAPNAQKIVAHQANHNLLLSGTAEIYSKPELEIYADDVKCKHGASTGQINEDALFYLRSRGVEREEAMQILLRGFATDVLQRIKNPAVVKRLQERIV